MLKSMLKCFIDDLLKMIDNIETLLKTQIKKYNTRLKQIKRKVALNLSRELMRDLIARVSSYALTKIQKQYRKLKQIEKDFENEALSSCTKIFDTTMRLSCSHVIKTRVKSDEKRLLLDDVHSHWRYRKPESTFTAERYEFLNDAASIFYNSETNNESDYDTDLKLSTISSLLQKSHIESLLEETDFIELSTISTLLQKSNMKSLSAKSSDSENSLLDAQEPAVSKFKGRPSGSKNKKGVMTRAEKKAVKFIKRDLSKFEHVKNVSRSRGKRDRATSTRGATSTREATSTRGATSTRARKGRSTRARGARGGRKDKGKEKEIIEVSSNEEETDDDFNDLSENSDSFNEEENVSDDENMNMH